MTPLDYFTQGLGLFASALIIIGFSQKSDKRFKIIIMLGTFVFSIHFVFLGAYSGAIVAIINVVRTWLSMKFHNSNYVLGGFIGVYLLAGSIVYEAPVDVLPIFSAILATVAFYKFSGIKLRVLFLFTECGWLSYSLMMKSIGGLITNIFVLSTNAITIYRLLKDKKAVTDDPII